MKSTLLSSVIRFILILGLTWILMRTAIYFLPGDPAEYLSHEALVDISPDLLREKMGLSRDPLERLISLPGGKSLIQGHSTWSTARSAFLKTLTLSAMTLLWVILTVPILLYFALRSSTTRKFLDFATLAIASTPLFVLGPTLLIFLSVKTGWFPVTHSVWLPSFALAIYLIGFWYRNLLYKIFDYSQRSAALGARSRGLSDTKIFFRYELMPCLGGFIGFISAQVSSVLSGSLLVEIIFQWNGIGSLLNDSIMTRDYPMIETTLMILSLMTVIVLFLGDRYQEKWKAKIGS